MGEREVEGRDKRMKKGWGIDIHCRPVDCGPLQFFSGGCAYAINRFLLLLSELKMQKKFTSFQLHNTEVSPPILLRRNAMPVVNRDNPFCVILDINHIIAGCI